MKKYHLFGALLSITILSSCVKTRNCECRTTWVEYTQYGAVEREETVAYPIKGTKNDVQTECDALNTNLNQENNDGYYTSCSLKK